MKVYTNRQWRNFLYRQEVPKKVFDDEFGYFRICEGGVPEDGYFKYKGGWYHLDSFMRIDKFAPKEFKEWDGYLSDTFFSGVLIRVSEDGEQYQVATYIG